MRAISNDCRNSNIVAKVSAKLLEFKCNPSSLKVRITAIVKVMKMEVKRVLIKKVLQWHNSRTSSSLLTLIIEETLVISMLLYNSCPSIYGKDIESSCFSRTRDWKCTSTFGLKVMNTLTTVFREIPQKFSLTSASD